MFSELKFPRAQPAAVAQGGYACACSFLNVRLRLFIFPREKINLPFSQQVRFVPVCLFSLFGFGFWEI